MKANYRLISAGFLAVSCLLAAGALAVFRPASVPPNKAPKSKLMSEAVSPLGDERGEALMNPLREKLGLTTGWVLYGNEREAEIKRWKPASSKIIFELKRPPDEYFYLIDVKRTPGRRGEDKDSLWEFPGGRNDPGEHPFAALLRELGEEDYSQTLKEAVEEAKSASLYFRNIELKNGEHHTLFKLSLKEATWEKLARAWKNPPSPRGELYGYDLLALKFLDTKEEDVRDQWTPKSRKLLHALRRRSP